MCRNFKWKEKKWQHVWNGCSRGIEHKGSWKANVVKILGEDRLGEKRSRGANERECKSQCKKWQG